MNNPPDKLCVQEMRSKNITKSIQVFLDGVEQSNRVTSYNTKEGWLKRHVWDDNNNPVIENDMFKIEKMRGTITVEWGKRK